ncbi:hypothetical protein EK904_009122 [Melospiza melodia maxima]|nr:hypothetical protein EK904_009122 [Melospiza melodia maxima]
MFGLEHADNEEEQWSDDFDSDYENPDDHSDSEMYVVPSEENPDDSYEPPPSEKEKKKIPSAFPISRGEYADNRPSHQKLPPMNKPLPSTPSPAMSRPKKPCVPSMPLPSPAAKPKVPPKPKECSDDEVKFTDIFVITVITTLCQWTMMMITIFNPQKAARHYLQDVSFSHLSL